MSTAGSRHCADVRGAYSGDEWSEKPARATEAQDGAGNASRIGSSGPAVAPLYEIAAAHDHQPPVEWLRYVVQMFRREAA